jgi:hypothetical protein
MAIFNQSPNRLTFQHKLGEILDGMRGTLDEVIAYLLLLKEKHKDEIGLYVHSHGDSIEGFIHELYCTRSESDDQFAYRQKMILRDKEARKEQYLKLKKEFENE